MKTKKTRKQTPLLPKETKLSKLKKGDLFKFPNRSIVYKYDGKLTRGNFHYHKFDDTSAAYKSKYDCLIETNFSF